jgi:hypothetical protein
MVYPAALKAVNSINGCILNNHESIESSGTDDKGYSFHRFSFIYSKAKSVPEPFAESSNTFYKLETRNLTLWNSIDNNGDIFKTVLKGLYVFSIVIGLPIADWLIGHFHGYQEGRIVVANGEPKLIALLKASPNLHSQSMISICDKITKHRVQQDKI